MLLRVRGWGVGVGVGAGCVHVSERSDCALSVVRSTRRGEKMETARGRVESVGI